MVVQLVHHPNDQALLVGPSRRRQRLPVGAFGELADLRGIELALVRVDADMHPPLVLGPRECAGADDRDLAVALGQRALEQHHMRHGLEGRAELAVIRERQPKVQGRQAFERGALYRRRDLGFVGRWPQRQPCGR
ncbi:hypothetical protein FQZ97_922670 [compost metagenome]